MKAYLIKASAPGPFKEYKKAMGAPPQNIFSVAAATPEGVDLELCDETIGMKPKMNTQADIVALFFHTPDANHAYRLAGRFRARGRTVVLGGLHPSFLPDEASEHADALLIGEAEGIWEELLGDFEKGRLKARYQRSEPVDLAGVKPYPLDLIPPSRYKNFWSVLVSRGCVHKCEFCAVPPFFNGKYRLRPIENIVAEIRAAPEDCWFELHADNLTADREYALELFRALKPLSIRWAGEATIKLADDEELLRAAAQSGCRELLIGIETPSQAALSNSGKSFVSPGQVREKIRRFHDFGISVTSSMIFGFDSHTQDIFRESEDFCRSIEIDEVESVILIPFPGTPLFGKLEKQNRLLTRDWSLYDGGNVVFTPKNMSARELEQGAAWFWREIRKKKKAADTKGAFSEKTRETPARARGPRLTTGGGYRKRYKSLLALGIIGTGFVLDMYWIWGVLFILWAVNDLKGRQTYLMDEIPRDEAPVLYWIVVLMWLFLGVWALAFSPASSWGKGPNGSVPIPLAVEESAEPRGGEDQLAQGKDSKAPQRVFGDSRFRFSMIVPQGWSKNKQVDPDSLTLDFRAPDQSGSLTLVAIDWQEKKPLGKLVGDMEKMLGPDLPFVNGGNRADPSQPVPCKAGMEMRFHEYAGKIQGHGVKALVGYARQNHHGFTLVGVYATFDTPMRKKVLASFSSFQRQP